MVCDNVGGSGRHYTHEISQVYKEWLRKALHTRRIYTHLKKVKDTEEKSRKVVSGMGL